MKRIACFLLAGVTAAGLGCTGPESARRAHEWKALRAQDDASVVPGRETVRFPSRSE